MPNTPPSMLVDPAFVREFTDALRESTIRDQLRLFLDNEPIVIPECDTHPSGIIGKIVSEVCSSLKNTGIACSPSEVMLIWLTDVYFGRHGV